jgi:hypothetical protein
VISINRGAVRVVAKRWVEKVLEGREEFDIYHPNTISTATMDFLATPSDSVTPFRVLRVMAAAIASSTPMKRPNSASFAALPEEIKVKIFEWCDFKGVLSWQLVRGRLFVVDT